MDKKTKILEAILYQRGEPVTIQELCELLHEEETALKGMLSTLQNSLTGHGISVAISATEAVLVTASDLSKEMKTIREEELDTPLGKGALETLTIILYRGPISKSSIDYLRGVNSATMLRNLLIRGLVEREEDPKDKRSFVYSASIKMYEFLGIEKREDLPEFAKISASSDSVLGSKLEEKEE